MGKRHENTKLQGPIDDNTFAFFKLQAGGGVFYQPTSETIQMPTIADSAEWSLANPFRIACKAECAAIRGLSLDLAARLETEIAPTGEAWEFKEVAPDDSSTMTAGTALSRSSAPTKPAKQQKLHATPLRPAVVPGAKKKGRNAKTT